MKKKEAEEALNQALWKHKYCPLNKNICNTGCLAYEEGGIEQKGRGYFPKYPSCKFFKVGVTDES